MVSRSEERDEKKPERPSSGVGKRPVLKRTSPPRRPGDCTRKKEVRRYTEEQNARRKKTGKRNRERGAETENHVVKDLRELGAEGIEKSREYHVPRVWDVRCTLCGHQFYFQVKRRKSWKWFTSFLKKMKTKRLNLLFIHVDFHEPFVCIRWSDFCRLVQGKQVGAEKQGMDDI